MHIRHTIQQTGINCIQPGQAQSQQPGGEVEYGMKENLIQEPADYFILGRFTQEEDVCLPL